MILVSFQRTLPLRVAEWAQAAMLTSWGAILWALPGHLSELTSHNLLGAWAEQWVWAVSFCFIGITRLVVLAINGAWKASPSARALLAFLTLCCWLTIALGLAAAPKHGTGLAIYPWLIALEFWNIHSAAGDARDAQHRVSGGH